MSHTFRKDCSAYEQTKFHQSHSPSATSTSLDQSSLSWQQTKMDSTQVSLGSDNHFGGTFSGSSSGLGGNFDERSSSHQNSEATFTARNHSGNCHSFGSREFDNSGKKFESGSFGSNNGDSAGKSG